MIRQRQYQNNPKDHASEMIPVISILKSEQRYSETNNDSFSRGRMNPSGVQKIDVLNIFSQENRS